MDIKVFWKKAGAGTLIAIVGLLLLLAGIIVTAVAEPFSYKDTTARIVEVSDGGERLYAEYIVNGEKRYGELNAAKTAYNIKLFTADHRIGDEVKAAYNPKDPSDVRVKGVNSYIYFLMAVGAMFILLGGVFIAIGLKKKPVLQKKESEAPQETEQK